MDTELRRENLAGEYRARKEEKKKADHVRGKGSEQEKYKFSHDPRF